MSRAVAPTIGRILKPDRSSKRAALISAAFNLDRALGA